MLERVRTIALVSLVTLLIWAFAEGQSVQEATAQVEVTFVSDGPNRLVRAQGAGWNGRAQLTFEGSTASIDALRERLRQGVRLTAGADFPSDTGERVVNLRDALRDHAMLRRTGVTVARTDPETVTVRVQELTTIEASVAVDAPGELIAGAPTVRPAAPVSVRVPAEEAEQWGAAPTLRIVIDADRLGRLEPGRSHTIQGLRPEGPEGLRIVEMAPSSVDVSVTVADRNETVVIASVPVHVRVSALVFNDYRVEVVDQFLPDVTVTGPSEEIDKLPKTPSGEVRLTAMVILSADDLERAVQGGGDLVTEAVFTEAPTTLSFSAERTTVRLLVSRTGEDGGFQSRVDPTMDAGLAEELVPEQPVSEDPPTRAAGVTPGAGTGAGR